MMRLAASAAAAMRSPRPSATSAAATVTAASRSWCFRGRGSPVSTSAAVSTPSRAYPSNHRHFSRRITSSRARLSGGGGGGGGGRGGGALPRVAALPEGTALGSHPLMAATVGRWTIADFDLVVDEVQLQSGIGVARIVRPASEDDVLDMYVELGLLDHDPYWAALWPSSIALARGVAEAAAADVLRQRQPGGKGAAAAETRNELLNESDRGNSVVGRDVCDLGAGLGLAGIAAALCGARSVVFYDREPLALQCCLLSAEAGA